MLDCFLQDILLEKGYIIISNSNESWPFKNNFPLRPFFVLLVKISHAAMKSSSGGNSLVYN
jgi:hypothetical protein